MTRKENLRRIMCLGLANCVKPRYPATTHVLGTLKFQSQKYAFVALTSIYIVVGFLSFLISFYTKVEGDENGGYKKYTA